jgi:thiol-disulfide isomerase/thioredoxin
MKYLLLFGALLLAGFRPLPVSPPSPDPLKPGQRAPDFRLLSSFGQAGTMKALRSKVVYLDFWYSGCKPCLAEAPAAAKLKKEFQGQDVVFLYISIETNIEGWLQTITQHDLAGPSSIHLIDPEGKYAAQAYGVVGFPTYLLIGRDGRIIDANAPRPSEGAKTVRALRQALK